MLTIRPETPGDTGAIRAVNEDAFGNSSEADLVEKLRTRGAITLSLVATDRNKIIGHILFSPVTIASGNAIYEALGLGPMSVLTSCQRQGIGSQLVLAGLQECRRLGNKIVVVLGHPDYYPRFGFVPASTYNINCEYDVPDEVFMAMELFTGALEGKSGTARYQPEFNEE